MPPSSHNDLISPLSAQGSEDWAQVIFESVPNGIIVADKSGRIVFTNEKAQLLFGYAAEEFLEMEIEDLVPPALRKAHKSQRAAFHMSGKSRTFGVGRDLCAVRKDGSEVLVEISLTPLPFPGREWVLSSIVDITTRKEAEQQLQNYADELEFQAEILNNVHDAVFYLNGEGIIQEWNEGAKQLFGHAAEDIVGQPVSRICFKESRLPLEKIEKMIRNEGVIEEIIHCEDASGRDVFVRAVVKIMHRDGESGYLVCARDITERRKLEAELLKVAEDQQRKIGQDIHDDLCSQLSGIGCLTKVLENQLAEDRRAESEMMKNITEMVAKAGTTARQIVHGLVPAILENQGLADALAELISVNKRTYGIDMRLSISEKNAISAIKTETGVQIYRIAQEAISNAIRHSDAEWVHISAAIKNKRFEMTIKDNGKGMSENLVSLGVGLATMRRRANLIHADFNIHAGPGEGTKVSCSVPLSSR